MVRWEYDVKSCKDEDSTKTMDWFDRMGQDGWELVAFDQNGEAWFKRRCAKKEET